MKQNDSTFPPSSSPGPGILDRSVVSAGSSGLDAHVQSGDLFLHEVHVYVAHVIVPCSSQGRGADSEGIFVRWNLDSQLAVTSLGRSTSA